MMYQLSPAMLGPWDDTVVFFRTNTAENSCVPFFWGHSLTRKEETSPEQTNHDPVFCTLKLKALLKKVINVELLGCKSSSHWLKKGKTSLN